MKQMFTSRFGEGGVIIEADYSALEVVGLAAFSQDKALMQALVSGTDMHCMRLAQQLGEPYEEVLKKCKDETHPDHKEYKKLRTNVKPKAFAYQYGATAHGIAFATGCTIEDAQAFIDAEKALFPEVEQFYDSKVFPMVEETGAKNMHREQTDDGVWRIYKRGYWRSPGGTCYSFRQHLRRVQGQQVMQYKPTEMRNYGIQGETAFWMQGICGLMFRYFLSKDFLGGKCLPINQVHDAAYYDCHKDVLAEAALAIKGIMECIPEYFMAIWPEYTLNVPFPVEVEAGASMFEKQHVKVDAEALAEFKRNYLKSLGIKHD